MKEKAVNTDPEIKEKNGQLRDTLINIEFHTVVLISALVSARAVGIRPKPKGAGQYYPRAETRAEFKTTV